MGTGANCSVPSIESIKSPRPISAAWPMRFSWTQTVLWESLITPEFLRAAGKHPALLPIREVHNEAHPFAHCDCGSIFAPRVSCRRPGGQLEAGSNSATARFQAAATEAHSTPERHGHLSAGRP